MTVNTKFLLTVFLFTNCRTAETPESNVKYETDQYSKEVYFDVGALQDTTDKLNEVINLGIQTAVQRSYPGIDRYEFIESYVSFFNSRQMETWVIDNPQIPSILPSVDKSVYKKNIIPMQKSGAISRFINKQIQILKQGVKSPIISSKGLSADIKVNSIIIGSDKLTHFISLGKLYLKKYLAYIDKKLAEEKVEELSELASDLQEKIQKEAIQAAINYGVSTEEGQWGRATTGVYSNADLVANYEGFKMHLDVFNGTSNLIGWKDDGTPYMKRAFDLREYVSPFWNESINPNTYRAILGESVKSVLYTYCDIYQKDPSKFIPGDIEVYEKKYKDVGIEPFETRLAYRQDKVCEEFNNMSDDEKSKYIQIDHQLEKDDNPSYNKGTWGLTIRDEGKVVKDKNRLKQILIDNSNFLTGCTSAVKSAIAEHDAIIYKHATSRFKIAKEFSGKMTDKPRRFSIDQQGGLQCKVIKVDDPNIRDNMEINIEYCKRDDGLIDYSYSMKYVSELENRLMESFGPLESVLDGEFENVSMQGYIEFTDLTGYVYRAIPTRCRWY